MPFTIWARSIAVIGDLLRNDIYLGVYRFHKSKHSKDADGSGYVIRRRQDNIVAGSREKPNHPPLIDVKTFELAQQKIAANRKKCGNLYMATGLLRCPMCGSPMHSTSE